MAGNHTRELCQFRRRATVPIRRDRCMFCGREINVQHVVLRMCETCEVWSHQLLRRLLVSMGLRQMRSVIDSSFPLPPVVRLWRCFACGRRPSTTYLGFLLCMDCSLRWQRSAQGTRIMSTGSSGATFRSLERVSRCLFCGLEPITNLYGFRLCRLCSFRWRRPLRAFTYRLKRTKAGYLNTLCEVCRQTRLTLTAAQGQSTSNHNDPSFNVYCNGDEDDMPRTSVNVWQLTLSNILAAAEYFDKDASLAQAEQSITDNPEMLILLSAKQHLYDLLRWTECLACFSMKHLSATNRLSMLISSWVELFILNTAFNSVDVEDSLVLANGWQLSRSQFGSGNLSSILNKFIQRLVVPLRQLKLDHTEQAILRTTVLFDTNPSDMLNNWRFHLIQSSLHCELHDCLSMDGKELTRLRTVLDLLWPLRVIACDCLTFLKSAGL